MFPKTSLFSSFALFLFRPSSLVIRTSSFATMSSHMYRKARLSCIYCPNEVQMKMLEEYNNPCCFQLQNRRDNKLATIPSTIEEELKCNPFMRVW